MNDMPCSECRRELCIWNEECKSRDCDNGECDYFDSGIDEVSDEEIARRIEDELNAYMKEWFEYLHEAESFD